jgi:hypothetical protein
MSEPSPASYPPRSFKASLLLMVSASLIAAALSGQPRANARTPNTASVSALGAPLILTPQDTTFHASTVNLTAGTEYMLQVSGTFSGSYNSRSFTSDALYCVNDTYTCTQINPPARDRTAPALLGGGSFGWGPIDGFEKANSIPGCQLCARPQVYLASHLYKVPFYPKNTGPLYATWACRVGGSGCYYTARKITIQI